MPRRTLTLPFPLDLRRSLQPLRLGKHDPTIELRSDAVLLAMRTPRGPATVRARHLGREVDVEAWGDGADWALAESPATLGLLDDRAGFDPRDEVVARLHRDAEGLRLPATGRVLDALVPALLSQRTTGFEAKRAYRGLIDGWGEPAPGPGGLRLIPRAEVIAELGYHDLHVVGIEKRRADTLKRACARAAGLERLPATSPAALRDRLESVAGIGRGTSAHVARLVLGDPDAVRIGDPYLKDLVCWALGGEPVASDDRMLELLEPYAGHRGRVCTIVETSGLSVPRDGHARPLESPGER